MNIQPNEDAQIAEVLEKLTNLESLRSAAGYAHEAISSENYDAQDALSQIGAAKKALEQVASHDAELARISSEIAAVNSTLADLAGDLSRYLGNLEQDAEISLEQAQQRKAAISAALRRYGPELDDLLVFQDSAVKELAELSISDDEFIDLEQKIVILHQSVLEMSNELTANRQAASSELQEAVSQELRSLAMPGASLNVNIEPLAELGQHGADAVQLLLCAYPGAEPRPISKSASGGELSRIMLAIEVVLARNEQVPTFIFDEVDAGVGGAAAIGAVGGPGATIEELTVRDETVAVTMSQIIAAEHLPSMVSKVVNGDIVIKRSETMAPFKDGKATGTFSAHVDGVPARVEGTQVLTGDENSATLEIYGEVEVKIPFLGGKIESAIVDEVVRLIQAEQDFTREWITK